MPNDIPVIRSEGVRWRYRSLPDKYLGVNETNEAQEMFDSGYIGDDGLDNYDLRVHVYKGKLILNTDSTAGDNIEIITPKDTTIQSGSNTNIQSHDNLTVTTNKNAIYTTALNQTISVGGSLTETVSGVGGYTQTVTTNRIINASNQTSTIANAYNLDATNSQIKTTNSNKFLSDNSILIQSDGAMSLGSVNNSIGIAANNNITLLTSVGHLEAIIKDWISLNSDSGHIEFIAAKHISMTAATEYMTLSIADGNLNLSAPNGQIIFTSKGLLYNVDGTVVFNTKGFTVNTTGNNLIQATETSTLRGTNSVILESIDGAITSTTKNFNINAENLKSTLTGEFNITAATTGLLSSIGAMTIQSASNKVNIKGTSVDITATTNPSIFTTKGLTINTTGENSFISTGNTSIIASEAASIVSATAGDSTLSLSTPEALLSSSNIVKLDGLNGVWFTASNGEWSFRTSPTLYATLTATSLSEDGTGGMLTLSNQFSAAKVWRAVWN